MFSSLLSFENFIFHFHLFRAVSCQSLLGAGNSGKPRREVTEAGRREPGWPASHTIPHFSHTISHFLSLASLGRWALVFSSRFAVWPGAREGLSRTPAFLEAPKGQIPSRGARPANQHLESSTVGSEEKKESKRHWQKLPGRGGGGSKAISFMLLSLWHRKTCLKQSA